MSYLQITREERYTITTLRRQGYSVLRIAKYLGRHRSSIYREVNRNRCNDGYYRPFKADLKTRARRSNSRRNAQFKVDDYALVQQYLKKDWSPEQVSGYLRLSNQLPSVMKPFINMFGLTKKVAVTYTSIYVVRRRSVASVTVLMIAEVA